MTWTKTVVNHPQLYPTLQVSKRLQPRHIPDNVESGHDVMQYCIAMRSCESKHIEYTEYTEMFMRNAKAHYHAIVAKKRAGNSIKCSHTLEL